MENWVNRSHWKPIHTCWWLVCNIGSLSWLTQWHNWHMCTVRVWKFNWWWSQCWLLCKYALRCAIAQCAMCISYIIGFASSAASLIGRIRKIAKTEFIRERILPSRIRSTHNSNEGPLMTASTGLWVQSSFYILKFTVGFSIQRSAYSWQLAEAYNIQWQFQLTWAMQSN